MIDIRTGTISITGLAALEKRLEAFPDKLAKNVLRGAIRAGAAVIQKEAKRLAPVSPDAHKLGKGSKAMLIQPGHLKKNINIRSAKRKTRSVPVEYWVYVSQKAWYWKFVEFGTAKMSMVPFMRPAFDTVRVTATERIREYLAARIEKEAVSR